MSYAYNVKRGKRASRARKEKNATIERTMGVAAVHSAAIRNRIGLRALVESMRPSTEAQTTWGAR